MPLQDLRGKAITVRGPVEPAALGRVLMHEHLHSDCYDWERQALVVEERPIAPARREMLMREAVPFLRQCGGHGCHAYVDVTPAPWRAWPTFMAEAAAAAEMHIVACTGFYCEMNDAEYWVKRPEDKIWPFVREASIEELADFCVRDIAEGMHGTGIRAGAIKLGGRNAGLSALEQKAFRAGARAQRATGVHITTHCTRKGAETAQLSLLDSEGVDLGRVVIGHTAGHLMDRETRKICMDWMRRGANFLPTNLKIHPERGPEEWRPLVEAIHEIFAAGLGGHLGFGLDWAFVSESGPFGPCTFMPPPPYLYMFTATLPAFRKLGLTASEEDAIMRANPQRILPVQ